MPKPVYSYESVSRTPTNNVVGKKLWGFLAKVEDVPDVWRSKSAGSDEGESLQTVPCESYDEVVNAFREALLWTDGLDHGLTVMLATTLSTVMTGDQLWVKILSPASAGKTTIAEAVAVAKDYVFSTSVFRGFYSGYGGGDQDHSLIELVRGKTLIIKDGDTLLQAPNLHQILSEMRDVYDTVGRSHYRTGKSAEYANVRTTVVICGTSSLKSIDASEAGERFLDCYVMDKIDDELEDAILLRVADNSEESLNYESSDDFRSHASPEMIKSRQLTGGFVEYLRENAVELLKGIEFPPEAKQKCTRYGKLVAHLRARPSKRQDEQHEREFAPRLVSQLVRLGKCLAVVLGKRTVDDEVLLRVRSVALDTCKGRGLDIVQVIRNSQNPNEGLAYETIALLTGIEKGKCLGLLKFFREIGVLETSRPKGSSKIKWRLQKRFSNICNEVFDDQHVPF